jgi:hypothetical protein
MKEIIVPANNQSKAQRKPVFGVAINDSPYMSELTINGKRVFCPAQRSWRDMLRRCFDSSYQEKFPTYQGCKPCSDWLFFSEFLKWWKENHIDGYHLDKDIIGCGKLYSPDNCIYVPSWINTFNTDSKSSRGEYKIGVSFDEKVGMFSSSCSQTILGGSGRIGYFPTEEEAYLAWKAKKIEITKSLKKRMDDVDLRIYTSIINTIKGK